MPDYKERPFEEVEKEYLELFDRFYGELREDGNGEKTGGLRTRLPERPAPDYEILAAQLREFALTEPSPMPLLSNASALLKEAMADVNWAGFYLRRETGGEPELLLGPFQGKTACILIPWGRGVCGTAAQEDRTQLVPDVHAFPGHIACDSASNAEIVVPIHRQDGSIAGVLDIDSPLKGRFSEEDRNGLEQFVRVLEQYAEWA